MLRTDPVLLEAQDLEASGGSGLLAFVDPVVRRKKMQEAAEKEAERAKKQKEESAKMSEDTGRGGGRGGREGGAEGGRGGEMYGASGVFDPDHPKRRPVVGMVRPAGVPLQDFEDVRIAHWAVVVAKVPIKEQVKLYRDAFENARGYNAMTDLPQYLGYFVERAEIRPGDEVGRFEVAKGQRLRRQEYRPLGPGGDVECDLWQRGSGGRSHRSRANSAFLTRDWVPGSMEVVDPRFMGTGPLVFPLPPLVGRDWGREVTHSEIPLAIDNVELEEEKKPEAKPEENKTDEEPADLFAGAANGMAGAGGRGADDGRPRRVWHGRRGTRRLRREWVAEEWAAATAWKAGDVAAMAWRVAAMVVKWVAEAA